MNTEPPNTDPRHAPTLTKEAGMTKLYIHREGAHDPEIVDINPSITVRDLLTQLGAGGEDRLWLEDNPKVLDDDLCIDSGEIPDRHHLHCAPVKEINVKVTFVDQHKHRGFPPSATVASVLQWATGPKGFNLPPDQRPKHELVISGSDEAVPGNVHVGSLVRRGEHEVCLDLRPKERFAG